MEISVEPSKTYAVTTSGSCTVTDADGLELCTASSGSQAFFVATTPTVTISDDGAKVSRATFNYALAVAGLLGGGADKLPAGYRRVEYLLSNGKQRVHTDFYPTSQSGVEMDFCVTEETSASSWFFGNGDTGRNDEPDKKFSLLYAHDRTYPRGLFYLGGDVAQNQIFALAGTRQLLKVANGIVSAGNGSMTAPTANFIGVTELTICAHVRQANAMSVRWYGCKLYENGELKKNFIPAVEKSTGTPGLYDTVGRVFKTNMGTGDFTYPTESSTYALRRVLPDWGKLTPHGLRRLYHAPADYEGDIYDYALANGYKQIVEPEQPDEGCWVPVWHEREDCIELEWVETEPPIEELSNVE